MIMISGLEDKHLWVVYAKNMETAVHIAELFRKEGYTNVHIEKLSDA
jgi:hypothetical protein